jgi:hypothetical protein
VFCSLVANLLVVVCLLFLGAEDWNIVKSAILQDVVPYIPFKVNWHFGGTCRAFLATYFHVNFGLAYYSTIQIEGISSSETSVDFQLTTRGCILADSTLQNLRCENPVYYIETTYSSEKLVSFYTQFWFCLRPVSCWVFCLLFYPENGGSISDRDVGELVPNLLTSRPGNQ